MTLIRDSKRLRARCATVAHCCSSGEIFCKLAELIVDYDLPELRSYVEDVLIVDFPWIAGSAAWLDLCRRKPHPITRLMRVILSKSIDNDTSMRDWASRALWHVKYSVVCVRKFPVFFRSFSVTVCPPTPFRFRY